MTTKDDKVMRSFDTGATRDTAEGKLDYEGFLSPVVLEQFAKFMNMNRLQSNGQLRDSDNWQKGIPMDVYRKSLMRHYMEFWLEQRRPKGCQNRVDTIGAACGMMFNIMGWLHEWLKTHDMVDFDGDEPTDEMRERRANIRENELVKPINETPADPVCTCCPGDCDCNTGQIYGSALPTYVDDGIPDHLCKDSNDCPVCQKVEAYDWFDSWYDDYGEDYTNFSRT